MVQYNKQDYPTLITVDNSNSNNIIGYLPGDYERVKCPKLIINADIQIMFFRGYYWTDNRLGASNDGLVSHNKNSEFIKNPNKIINSVLNGLNYSKILFNDKEKVIIDEWYKESLKFHREIYF